MNSPEQLQRPQGSPAQPRGQGFIAATNWKRAGDSDCRAARETVTRPDSAARALRARGAATRTFVEELLHPPCASEFRPAWAANRRRPAPRRWTCGAAREAVAANAAGRYRCAAAKAMAAHSSASSSPSGGNGKREASSVLPLPRRADHQQVMRAGRRHFQRAACGWSWPRTSARSGELSGIWWGGCGSTRGSSCSPRRRTHVQQRGRHAYVTMPTHAGLGGVGPGSTMPRSPRRSVITAGNAPRTALARP